MVASGIPRAETAARRRARRTWAAVAAALGTWATLSGWTGMAVMCFSASCGPSGPVRVCGNRRAPEGARTGTSRRGRPRPRTSSGGVLQRREQLLEGLAQLAHLDARGDLREPVDHAVQAEQQREGDRADAGAGEQQDAEGDRHQAGNDEQRARARGLPAAEPDDDLDHAAGQGPG